MTARAPSTQQPLPRVKALYDFVPQGSNELEMKKGDVVRVLRNDFSPDWWRGELHGKVGDFPVTYVVSSLTA